MTPLPIRWLAEITCDPFRYTHYPVREMDRIEAERLLALPEHAQTLIIRSSPSSRRSHPNVHYVVSYIHQQSQRAHHVLVTEEDHLSVRGHLNALLPVPLRTYQLTIHPTPFFSLTRRVPSPGQTEPTESTEPTD